MTRDAVTSDQMPAPGLRFSVAVRGGGLLFLSGQVAQDPATGLLVDGDVAQQADQILRNIAATLAAIGKDLDYVSALGSADRPNDPSAHIPLSTPWAEARRLAYTRGRRRSSPRGERHR